MNSATNATSTIRKIFSGISDEAVHNEFIKFGRGEFNNKYVIEAKKQKNNYSIKTSAEFANFLVKKGMEKAMNEGATDVNAIGVIISTFDLTKDIKFQIENVKKYLGVNKLIINAAVKPMDLIELMDKYPRVFYALSFSFDDYELKVKPKPPKSPKPNALGEKKSEANFCSLKTSNQEIISELFFDLPQFSYASITHKIIINDIIMPKDEKDPVKIRELAKRKGVLIREIIADGKKTTAEKDFLA